MSYFTYILECSDGTLYTGSTADLARRVREHNESKKGARYTKMRRPVVLKYSEEFHTLSESLKREVAIKKLKKPEKEILIKEKYRKIG